MEFLDIPYHIKTIQPTAGRLSGVMEEKDNYSALAGGYNSPKVFDPFTQYQPNKLFVNQNSDLAPNFISLTIVPIKE